MTTSGWYKDPSDPSYWKYWDDESWTEHRTSKGREDSGDNGSRDLAGEMDEGDGVADARSPAAIMSDARAASWPREPPLWCRSCGVVVSDADAFCPECQWEIHPSEEQSTLVGLLYALKSRRIGPTRLGLCVDENNDHLTIHVNPKTIVKVPRR